MTPIAPNAFNVLVANPTYKSFCKEIIDLTSAFALIQDWYAWLITENPLDGTIRYSDAFNQMICEVLSTCAGTTTSTTTSTTTTSTTTSGSTSTSTTTTDTTTTTTTTAGETFIATITPNILNSTRVAFGLFLAAGHYRVKYVTGALQYHTGTKWLLNQGPSNGYRIYYNNGYATLTGPERLPLTGFLDPADTYAYNDGTFVDFNHTGGEIAMYLLDAPNYGDNYAGPPGTPPTFSLYRVVP